MTEEVLISATSFETRLALLVDGSVQEVHFARSDYATVTGNIYVGRVDRVVPGMQAAFVDVGLERPGFLHVNDLSDTRFRPDDGDVRPDIRSLLHPGQELMVQILKDPISTKGARLTSQIALPSRYLVLMPFNDHVGVSQRIDEDGERDRLKQTIERVRESLAMPTGFIARTAAEGLDEETLTADARFLSRLWDRVMEKRRHAGVPALVYGELPMQIRVIRDLVSAELTEIRVDDRTTHERVMRFVNEFVPELADRVVLDTGRTSAFAARGIDKEIRRALGKHVPLKSGGSLVIEQTEAMTTIDVNTGAYLGVRDLEETVFRTNLEAAGAIPRQLRLRNLGGLIVIDFIDMEVEEHRRQVLRALEKATENDPARTRIEPFSSFGLIQMSRKRTRESLVQQLCEPCAGCDGAGRVPSSNTTCIEIFRAVMRDAERRCADKPAVGEYLIRTSEGVVDRLLDEDAQFLDELAQMVGREIRIQVEPSCRPGQFDLMLVEGAER